MPLYKKKPIVIEARQFFFENVYEIADWCGASVINNVQLSIPTLEGTTIASLNDYVICGVKGEFYACKPDIFEMTYEAIDEELA